MRTFETPRLRLRLLGQGDEALYCRLYTDPAVMRQVAAPLSAAAARTAFGTVTHLMQDEAPTMHLWALRERNSGTDIGILALLRDAELPDAREIGTMLLVEGQGRGFAVEAQEAVLDHLFTIQGIRTVCSNHAPGHGAVVGVKQKLGFVRVDPSDAHADRVRWQLSRERWNARHLVAAVEKRDGCR